MLKRTLLILVSFFLLSGNILSQTVIGKYAGEFMAIGVGGKALGMGGAQVAVANDVTAGYWNPAGLAFIDYPQGALMHEEHFGNLVNYNYGAVAIPYGKDMSFGISVIRLAIDDIPGTKNFLINGITGETIYDIEDPNARTDPSRIEFFNNVDYAFYLTFAKRASDNFYWGANVKIISRSLEKESAFGVGFDAGAVYMPMDNLYLGANIMDLTTTLVAWSTGRNELVTPTAKIGAAYGLEILGGVLTPAVDFDIRFENRQFASNFNLGPVSFDFRGGLEFTFQNIVSIRGGYTDVQQYTVGAGIKLPKLNIDYSFAQFTGSQYETLHEESHRISLKLTLEEPRFLRMGQ